MGIPFAFKYLRQVSRFLYLLARNGHARSCRTSPFCGPYRRTARAAHLPPHHDPERRHTTAQVVPISAVQIHSGAARAAPIFHQTAPGESYWNESDSFRETTLQLFDDPDRQAVRRLGHVLYDLAVFASREQGGEESVTRAELRAVAADLRYTGGYLLHQIARSADVRSLDESDDRLARFAGKVGRKVTALVESIEERLS